MSELDQLYDQMAAKLARLGDTWSAAAIRQRRCVARVRHDPLNGLRCGVCQRVIEDREPPPCYIGLGGTE